MIKIKKEGIILEPTEQQFENQAVLNPAAIRVGDNVHIFYRAVKKGNYSTIGHAKLKGPLDVIERAKKPILAPEYHFEIHGTEDPRIVKIGTKYHLTYMGYNGKDVVAAYAVSTNLRRFHKRGIIFPLFSYSHAMHHLGKTKQGSRCRACWKIYDKAEEDTKETTYIWGKDVALFPKKINGKYALLHRILPDMPLIYFKSFKDLTRKYWANHFRHLSDHIVVSADKWFESRQVGAGAPPIETDKGWLMIYHAVEETKKGKYYRAAAALLDKKDPTKLIGKLKQPLFSPEKRWELKGDVDNVVFPTGTALFDDRLYIYYGAADTRIAVASVDINKLLDELTRSK
jgi:predicted GH43/DUF377 family glycosyl hydrolase